MTTPLRWLFLCSLVAGCTPGSGSPGGLIDILSQTQAYSVAFMGESYAAGEGNPDIPKPQGLWWSDAQCHRSGANGRRPAAEALHVPESLVGFEIIDVACSGATINEGLIGGYFGIPHPSQTFPLLDPQVSQVQAWMNLMGVDSMDAVVFSIGGNDVGFAEVVEGCINGTLGECSEIETLRELIDEGDGDAARIGFDNLRSAYRTLDQRIRTDLKPRHVFIIGVPDPLRDERAEYCHAFNDNYGVRPELLFTGPLVPTTIVGRTLNIQGSLRNLSRTENEWIYNNFVARLNNVMREAAAEHDWIYVDGMESLTRRHGYCSKTRWFNTLKDSDAVQGDYTGSAHPNRHGYEAYKHVVMKALAETLRPRVVPPPVVITDGESSRRIFVRRDTEIGGVQMPTAHEVIAVDLEFARNRPASQAFTSPAEIERVGTTTKQSFGFEHDVFATIRIPTMCNWAHYRWRITYRDFHTNEQHVTVAPGGVMRATVSASPSGSVTGLCDPIPA